MRVRNAGGLENEKGVELQMTPMIDIVFQLLIFFIMTFKIVSLEGDFSIKMPLGAPSEGVPDEPEVAPMRLSMRANADGSLKSMKLDNQSMGSGLTSPGAVRSAFGELHREIITRVGSEGAPGGVRETAEVILDCDYNLKYEYVIAAITNVSGYISDPEKKTVVRLIEKIKFAPPPKEPGT